MANQHPVPDTPSGGPSSSLARITPIGELPLSAEPQPNAELGSKPPAAPSFFLKALAFTLRPWLSGASDLSDEERALFISPNQPGIPSSKSIPEAVSNYQLFIKADAVQRINHPIYSVDDGGSYHGLLYSFLRYIKDLHAKPGVAEARSKLIAAEQIKNEQWQQARQQYISERTGTHQVTETFMEYLDNCAAYQNAWSAEERAQAAYEDLLSPEMQDYARKLDIVKSANDRTVFKMENNMPCDATTLDYINEAYLRQKPITSDPRNIYYRPLYSAADYAHVVNNWSIPALRTAQDSQGPYPIIIDPESLAQCSWAELGHPELDKIPAPAFTADQADILSRTTASITFRGKPAAFNIERGWWDLSPLKAQPLSDDAPDYLKQRFVKTTSLLAAWGLEINVSLPSGISAKSIASLQMYKWGVPFSTVGTSGTQFRFTAGDAFYPIVVAALGKLVGGAAPGKGKG